MTGIRGWTAGAVLALAAGAGQADEAMTVAGRQVSVSEDGMGSAALAVDGVVLLQDGVISLDPKPLTVGGVTVVTGVSGAGGNACNPAPFVLVLPATGAAVLEGPVDSCAYLTVVDVQPEAIVFASEPLPSEPGEVWVWNGGTGFSEALPEEFTPTTGAGWEQLESLAGAHPADALALAPVYDALVAGLGADYPVFAERISGLGSGGLTPEGYLGEACLKFTCGADFAVLYLHRETRQVYAIWHVTGEIENRIFPQDTTLWPPEAKAALRDTAGD